MSQDLVGTAGKKVVKEYSLDPVRPAFEEFLMRTARTKADQAWCNRFKTMAKEVSQGAESFTVEGRAVARIALGQLNETQLAEQLPDMYKKYVRPVTEMKFDQEAFRHDNPELFKAFRARRFCVTGE